LAKKSILEPQVEQADGTTIISDFVRLCFAEGIKPSEAYREMRKKLVTIKELKKNRVVTSCLISDS